MLIELGVALASGTDWIGMDCKKAKVLYASFENGKDNVHERIKAITKVKDLDVNSLRQNLKCIKYISEEWDISHITHVIQNISKELGTNVILIDSVDRLIENDLHKEEDMWDAIDCLEALALETECAIVCLNRQKSEVSSRSSCELRLCCESFIHMRRIKLPDFTKVYGSLWSLTKMYGSFPETNVSIKYSYPLHKRLSR